MSDEPSPPGSLPRRLISAIDELVAFVKARYWEADLDHYMDEAEQMALADLEGRVIGLLSKIDLARVNFPLSPPGGTGGTPDYHFTPTGVMYFFVGPGTNLDRDDHWEVRMRTLRAAVETVAMEEERDVAGPTPPRQPAARDRKTEARDKWIYGQCCKSVPFETIVIQLKSKKGWYEIGTKQGIQAAAKRYASRHNLPQSPARQDR